MTEAAGNPGVQVADGIAVSLPGQNLSVVVVLSVSADPHVAVLLACYVSRVRHWLLLFWMLQNWV